MKKGAKRKSGDLADWPGRLRLVRELRKVLEDDAKRGSGVLAHWHAVADSRLWALAFASFWRAHCSGDARAEDEAARRLLQLPGKLIPDPQWKRAEQAGIRGEVDPLGADPNWEAQLFHGFRELAPAVTRLVAPGAILDVLGPGPDPKHPAPWIKARWKLADRVQGRRATELVAHYLGEEPRRRIRRETREERVTCDAEGGSSVADHEWFDRQTARAQGWVPEVGGTPVLEAEVGVLEEELRTVAWAAWEEGLEALSPGLARVAVFDTCVRDRDEKSSADMAALLRMSSAAYRQAASRGRKVLRPRILDALDLNNKGETK